VYGIPPVFTKAQSWVTKRREAGRLQFLIYRYYENKEWKATYTEAHKFVDQQAARALQETANDKPHSDSSPVRKRYILLDEMAKQIRDPIQLRYHVLGVFNPTRDTTSRAVGNGIFQLARHPHI
jgi:cytochrome P450 monooxygenase